MKTTEEYEVHPNLSGPTFELLKSRSGWAIRCKRCRRISYNGGDIINRYCAGCRRFHAEMAREQGAGAA